MFLMYLKHTKNILILFLRGKFMIYINSEKENDVIILCDCGCESSIHISKFYTDE